ncbi:MAG: DUF4150 domain-containing protein [Pseudomonadota bacterium]
MGGVFANGLEISGKAVDAKTIAVMPDTCFTPPEAPPTPMGVPIPYPSFGMAGDTDKGTGTVKIGGKTVNIKNKSHLTKTTGTEAGSAAKKGIITSKNTGKEQFNSWSNDVKFDGEPVIRNTDMATNNHASPAGNSPPWAHYAGVNYSKEDCPDILLKHGLSVHKHGDKKDNCNYDDSSKPKQQSDHFPQTACFTVGTGRNNGMTFPGVGNGPVQYKAEDAPCVCLENATSGSTEHGRKSHFQRWNSTVWQKRAKKGWKPTYKHAKRADLNAMRYAKSPELNPDKDGNEHPALKCLELEMDKYFKDELGMKEDTEVAIPTWRNADKTFLKRVTQFRNRLR